MSNPLRFARAQSISLAGSTRRLASEIHEIIQALSPRARLAR